MDHHPLRAKIELTLEHFKELGVEEDQGKLYLPVELRQRAADGSATVISPAVMCLPTNRQRIRARTESRALGQKLGLDLDRDRDHYDQLENYALLAFCLRDPKTKGQLEPTLEGLLDRFLDTTLNQMWTTLNAWCDLLDPRYGELTTEQLWRVIAAVAVGGATIPLGAMPTFEHHTCIVLMAREALRSPNAPSWLASLPTSASASSPEPRSQPSSAASTPTADPSSSPE